VSSKLFDLNIEDVLDNWEVEHALREVIANALDEQVLSHTADIQIFKDEQGNRHVRDFGRGLRIEHFTLNENQEKLHATSTVIGKFGVGLKDALATFHRRGIDVRIRSSFGSYRLRKAQKHNFGDIATLHVEYDDTPTNLHGTEFILGGATDSHIEKAKALFLRFAGEEVIETGRYGQILQRQDGAARVYILGVLASEEPNFMLSYNITSLTEGMKKRLNRERLNVGRTTYTDRVKAILKEATSQTVHNLLVEQVKKRASGDQCDEMGWTEISHMALNLMHQQARVVYLTEQELQSKPNVLDNARRDGYEPVVISEQQKTKLEQQMASGGVQLRTAETYVQEFNASFQYRFVASENLTSEEQRIWRLTSHILALVGLSGRRAPRTLISETMRITNDNTGGVWDSAQGAIVIKRSQLASLASYAGTLLHEAAHATPGAVDATRDFESVLTKYLGETAAAAVTQPANSSISDTGEEKATVFGRIFRR
jgi:hypothetical protein